MSEGVMGLLLDARRAKKQGTAAIAQRQRVRFAEMVAFARARSPYYRELYRGLPEQVDKAELLPVTNKTTLMKHFDDWVTDRAITLEETRAFIDNPTLIGERLRGKYTVATTSGTTGTRGIFLMDDRNLAVATVLAIRMMSTWLGDGDVIRLLGGGRRMTIVIATDDHFASAAAATRLLKARPWCRKALQVLTVQMPLPEMVAQLNRFQPAILAPYASMAALLASEQESGRLRINPVLVVLSVEGLALSEYDRVARAFKAKVRQGYASPECLFLSYSCEHGWLHVHSDWVVLEPVDADFRPVPPGMQSHTVLLSNLANRVQPILRYDLGDSILKRPDSCPCGSPLPAVRVQGRASDALTFPNHERT